MEQVAGSTRFTAEGGEWEVRAAPPSRYREGVGVGWELEQLTGDQSLGYHVTLQTGAGRQAVDNRPNAAFATPDEGDLYGDLGGASTVTLIIELDNEGRTRLGTISLDVPTSETPALKQRESPITVPVWAKPPGVDSVVTPAGERGAWTEMVIESFDAEARPGGVSWAATVSAAGVNGGSGTVSRQLNVRRTYPDRRLPVNSNRTEAWAEIGVSVGVGETKTLEGDLSFSGEQEVIAYVGQQYVGEMPYNPRLADFGSYSTDLKAVNLWETGPLEAVQIPYPADAAAIDVLANVPAVAEWALQGYMDGFDFGYRQTQAVGEREFQAAVLAYQEDLIGDEQMAALHAMFATEAETDALGASASNHPFIVGALDNEPGVIRLSIANDRSGSQPPTHPAVYGYGPGVAFADDFSNASSGDVAIEGCVPGEDYTFTTDRDQYDSNTPYTGSRAGEVLAKARVSAGEVTPEPAPEPKPEPDPDPEPVEPSVEAACDFDGAEINVGGSVTVPVRVAAGDGDTDTEATVRIEVAGESATETVTLGPNDSTRVEATFEIAEPGDYTPTITLE